MKWMGEELQEFAYLIERREVYADAGENNSPRFVPLEDLGEEV